MASAPQSSTPQKKSRTSLLRDYYGLPPPPSKDSSGASPPPPEPTFRLEEEHRKALAAAIAPHPSSSGPGWEKTHALPALLKHEAQLLSEIRQLDGERQSLVYNHHHELISASETIKEMNQKAASSDTCLASLQGSFQSIAQLSSLLYQPSMGALPQPRQPVTVSVPPSSGDDSSKAGATRTTLTLSADQQRELRLIVSLPQRLREVMAAEAPSPSQPLSDGVSSTGGVLPATTKLANAIQAAQRVLDRDESVVVKWSEEGNTDAGKILEEARLILHNARELQRQSMMLA